MKKIKLFLMVFMFCSMLVNVCFATPSTQIWNPSTDIQAEKTWHLGIDNYFSVQDNKDNPVAFPTDLGLTYGLIKNLEIGIDLFYPSENPLYLNAKYGIPEKDQIPAFAVGVFNVGTEKDVTDYNIAYGVLSKTISTIGRLSVGGYIGNDKLLVDEKGEKANTGLIATWDKTLNDKVWASIDYASGNSFYGSLTPGFSYTFAPNTSIIFGYTIYNNDKLNVNNTFTTQLDINF
ncbi:hypothetical protein HY745_14970 [Candidatus Desantisbacteria bacterium]|nr:hypothetical protein [Candidatus Desantisbacteria bacterium]